jgi:Eco57I restriction-modification methylase
MVGMNEPQVIETSRDSAVETLSQTWGSVDAVNLYLDRCQVDTPLHVVEEVWRQVRERRQKLLHAVDFGAGDGRFARGGTYNRYTGFEIDPLRCTTSDLPPGAQLRLVCAFEETLEQVDLCIGNPPYVRNQDLPAGWRQRAESILKERTGVSMSGLANAWQYFFLLSLATTSSTGLTALVIPYEWVSRPSAKSLRKYILENGWTVSVYRLQDSTFHRVLTTSSITIVDKRAADGTWSYFDQEPDGSFKQMSSPTGTRKGVLAYAGRTNRKISARRGLSPGSQAIFTLSEGDRVRNGLKITRDVVPCVTSLKPLSGGENLNEKTFNSFYREAGQKCWLLKPHGKQSREMKLYLGSITAAQRNTSTCRSRDEWWNFSMPTTPDILIATGFTGKVPKVAANVYGVVAVGGVAGIYGVAKTNVRRWVAAIESWDLSGIIVPHANGLRKLEINQLNTLLDGEAKHASR